jgi:hypothetical protein
VLHIVLQVYSLSLTHL